MIEVQRLDNAIAFRVSDDLLNQVHEWEFSMDDMVFKEQLAMGSFRGRYAVDGFILQLMRQAEEQGTLNLKISNNIDNISFFIVSEICSISSISPSR